MKRIIHGTKAMDFITRIFQPFTHASSTARPTTVSAPTPRTATSVSTNHATRQPPNGERVVSAALRRRYDASTASGSSELAPTDRGWRYRDDVPDLPRYERYDSNPVRRTPDAIQNEVLSALEQSRREASETSTPLLEPDDVSLDAPQNLAARRAGSNESARFAARLQRLQTSHAQDASRPTTPGADNQDDHDLQLGLAMSLSLQSAEEEEMNRVKQLSLQSMEDDEVARAEKLSLQTHAEEELVRAVMALSIKSAEEEDLQRAMSASQAGQSTSPFDPVPEGPTFHNQDRAASFAADANQPKGNLCGALALAHMTQGDPREIWPTLHRTAVESELSRQKIDLWDVTPEKLQAIHTNLLDGMHIEDLSQTLDNMGIPHLCETAIDEPIRMNTTIADMFRGNCKGATYHYVRPSGTSHFAALYKDDSGQWWNMDSLNAGPEKITSPRAFLQDKCIEETAKQGQFQCIFLM